MKLFPFRHNVLCYAKISASKIRMLTLSWRGDSSTSCRAAAVHPLL